MPNHRYNELFHVLDYVSTIFFLLTSDHDSQPSAVDDTHPHYQVTLLSEPQNYF